MKKIILSLLVAVVSLSVFAQDKQTAVIKAGTVITLEAIEEVRGAKANPGQSVDFKVQRDVIVDGVVAIPAGTLAKGTVYEAKRSTVFGTRGRLGIKLRYLITQAGEYVNFTGSEVYIKGKNYTAGSVVLFCFTLLPLPCGSKAVMPIGYEVEATVASNTQVTL